MPPYLMWIIIANLPHINYYVKRYLVFFRIFLKNLTAEIAETAEDLIKGVRSQNPEFRIETAVILA